MASLTVKSNLISFCKPNQAILYGKSLKLRKNIAFCNGKHTNCNTNNPSLQKKATKSTILNRIQTFRDFGSAAIAYSKNWYSVTYVKPSGEKITVKGKDGDNLLDIAINNNVDLEGFGACEGTLSCSTCHLIFAKENYDKIPDPPADEELDMLDLAFGYTNTEKVKCVSLSGSGFLGLYLIGAAKYLKEHFPCFLKRVSLAGSSAGAVIASGLICDVSLDFIRLVFLKTAAHAQESLLGPFGFNFNIQTHLAEGLSSLPEDAHLRANGRLYISLTRVKDFQNVIISNWESKEELIQTVLCSCFIPGFSGTRIPTINGVHYIDGGFSNAQPTPMPNTLTISPFNASAHISPKIRGFIMPETKKEGNASWGNYTSLHRYYRSIIPSPPHEMMYYYWEGYEDARTSISTQLLKKKSNHK